MHTPGLGKRERLTDKPSQALSKRQIEALRRVRSATSFWAGTMLTLGDDREVGFVKVGIDQFLAVGNRNLAPEFPTGIGTSVADHGSDYLPRLEGNDNPHPGFMCLAKDEAPEFIGFQAVASLSGNERVSQWR